MHSERVVILAISLSAPRRVQYKMEVLYLKSYSLLPEKICSLCSGSKPTFCHYLHEYRDGGIEQPKEALFHRL